MSIRSRCRLLAVLLIAAVVLELAWALTPYNLLSDVYRRAPRQEAFVKWARSRTPEAEAVLDEERRDGVNRADAWSNFGARVNTLLADLVALLTNLRKQGKRTAAYGAAAKGATLLNCAGIGTELVEYVVDRSPHKQGLLMPGVRLPIRPTEFLLQDRPDHVLILAWNLAEESRRP